MALSEAERTDVRRHCGYPAHGTGADGFQAWRFTQSFGLLEYRLGRLTGSEEAVVRDYLATLKVLEAAVPAMSDMLDTDQAAVWKRNPRELRERTRLFDDWRRRLCGFLGLPPGPALGVGAPVVVV